MEQPYGLLNKCDAQLSCCILDGLIILAAQWSGNIFYTRTGDTENVVDERELQGRRRRVVSMMRRT